MSAHPSITATPDADGYTLSLRGVRLGALFRVNAGWVTAGGRQWRRSRPYETAEEAAEVRWGPAARDALALARETSKEPA